MAHAAVTKLKPNTTGTLAFKAVVRSQGLLRPMKLSTAALVAIRVLLLS
jgi:hypothetical protein